MEGHQFGLLMTFAAVAAISAAFGFGRFSLFAVVFLSLTIFICIGDVICQAVRGCRLLGRLPDSTERDEEVNR